MRAWWVIGWLGVVGCQKPDATEIVSPLQTTLGAAVPTAYFAAVSMAALGGRPSPCASVTTPAGSSTVHVDVSLGAGCPPMFGAGEGGVVAVTGTWTPQLGTFFMDYTNMQFDGQPWAVEGVANMTVVPMNGTHLVIAYGEQDVMIAQGALQGAGVEQVGWAVDVDTGGTDDPSDDAFTISGGDQTILAAGGAGTPLADVTQVAIGAVGFSRGCRKNPASGIAAVQRAGTRGGGWVLFGFHSDCDGTADVAAALAPYEPLISDSLPLAFLQ